MTMQPPAPDSAVDLAEKYEYAALVRAVQLRPELAMEVGDFGMTPLHWVCSDPRVPLRTLQKLVLAHPRAAAVTNLAGLLPLHIALRKNLPLDALKLLLKFYPKAIAAPTPDGRTPLELAADHVTAPSARLYLEMLDAEVRALGRVAAASKKVQKQQQLRDACEPAPPRDAGAPPRRHRTRRAGSVRSQSSLTEHQLERELAGAARQHEPLPSPAAARHDPIAECLSSPSMRAAVAPQRAPAWKLSKRCHVCECKFGYFKSRHHCRNCGESVCGRHSRESLPLRHIGLFHPQRVCALCHEHLQNAFAGCNTSEHERGGSGGGAYSPTSDAGDSGGRRSLFWSPEALSPRIFGAPPPPPPKRTQSVRDYLLASPQRPCAPTFESAASASGSPTARSVRSEASERHYSHATLSGLPMFPSTSSMFLGRVQLAPAPSQLVRHAKRDSGREREAAAASAGATTAATGGSDRASASRRRRLAKTELDAPSKPWYEELDQLPPTPGGQKLSMDSRVSELEEHVHRLLVAKKQIGDALRKSQQQIYLARAEKDKYDAIAHKYLAEGFAPCSPLSPAPTRGVDLELAAALGCCVDLMDITTTNSNNDDNDDDGFARQEPAVSSRTTASTSASSRETACESDVAVDSQRATLSDVGARPSSPLPAPSLSPFRSEQLDLPLPLDVAATHHELGVVLLGRCDFASAAAAFRKSLDINANDAVAWFHLAKALDGAGELTGAEHAVNQSLALDAASLPSLSLLGRLLHLRGEHDEAIVVFRKALNLQCPPATDDDDDDDDDSDNRVSNLSSAA
ncbi:hypothetical protein PybrP1_011997 [[Pythium] brassicae (nom. inval.)]|nr:hypothetical protein PybrP1_011997 [[Pythium] brassicae (nom. inval.)]